MYSEQATEQEIRDKGLSGPRLMPHDIDDRILTAHYYIVPATTCTVCALVLINGFVVIGESACVSPENFDEEIGRRIAYAHAREQIWKLEGYALRDKLTRRG